MLPFFIVIYYASIHTGAWRYGRNAMLESSLFSTEIYPHNGNLPYFDICLERDPATHVKWESAQLFIW